MATSKAARTSGSSCRPRRRRSAAGTRNVVGHDVVEALATSCRRALDPAVGDVVADRADRLDRGVDVEFGPRHDGGVVQPLAAGPPAAKVDHAKHAAILRSAPGSTAVICRQYRVPSDRSCDTIAPIVFPGFGTVVNVATVIVGSAIGLLLGHRLPLRTRRDGDRRARSGHPADRRRWPPSRCTSRRTGGRGRRRSAPVLIVLGCAAARRHRRVAGRHRGAAGGLRGLAAPLG